MPGYVGAALDGRARAHDVGRVGTGVGDIFPDLCQIAKVYSERRSCRRPSSALRGIVRRMTQAVPAQRVFLIRAARRLLAPGDPAAP